MRILGIDPGLDGAIAVLDIREATNIYFYDTPTITIQGTKKSHREIDAAQLVNLLLPMTGNLRAILEKVSNVPIKLGKRELCPTCHRMPAQGGTSLFNFGMGFGIWIGILAGLKIPYTLVHPRTWKSAVMRDMGKEKGASILRAKQLYPQAAPSLNLAKHHGRADALLMAHYLRLNYQGINKGFLGEEKQFALQSEEGPF